MSGLDLRTRESTMKGGTRGPVLIAGKPAESLLISAVRHEGKLAMPPGKNSLDPQQIAVLEAWVKAGAPWSATADPSAQQPTWWSLRPPKKAQAPETASAEWSRNPVDRFIYAKLREKQLRPAPVATPQILARRLYFDLTGLPPTPDQMSDFINDKSPGAYEKLVDKLLASPQYGERWGRMWLDVARYADTSGFEGDVYFPNAWRYRDYVIRAFNNNKPYDQFVQEQIAADEIWPNDLRNEGSYILPDNKKVDFERLLGTGFYTVGPYDPTAKLNEEQYQFERMTEWVDTTASAFLGLTVGCARCHDHKFDPISQRDYYRLAAIFSGTETAEVPAVDSMEVKNWLKTWPKRLATEELRKTILRLDDSVRKREIRRIESQLDPAVVAAARIRSEDRTAAQRAAAEQHKKALAALTKEKLLEALTADEKKKREHLVAQFVDASLNAAQPPPTATVLAHTDRIRPVHIAQRGNFRNKGPVVGPGLLTPLSDGNDISEPEGVAVVPQRRKALALWLTSKDNPLTARVFINRLWQGHFGRGIVPTPGDFGRQGDPPSHTELLDWLAVDFMENGWDVKRIQRMILLSRAYRSSNAPDLQNAALDPDNKYLWRMNRRRLEAEAVRDSILAVSGRLNTKMFGPAVIPPLNTEEIAALEDASQWPATTDGDEARRRSIYMYSKRTFKIPFLETFDQPDTTLACSRRDSTNVAPQALALLNSPFVRGEAEFLASELMRTHADNPQAMVVAAWRRALGRDPDETEFARSLAIIGSAAANATVTSGQTTSASVVRFCMALFNLNEFLYVD